ncbi:Cytochrome P450 78A11 [Glycine soja]|uniref:Cytochrome P450 78A11 n=1 Tax=Glycine soja TaxID=3848 RepID=A0A0B2PQZ1_GLYSO|nr:Cytochrome P450 78A11 [Glycine soja]
MGFAPYGEYYKNLRRIYATHMFYLRRIVAFGEFWAQVGAQMVKEIIGLVRKYNVVEVRKVLHFGLLSNVMKSIFGRRYVFELKELVTEGYDLLGVFNWSDHFPILDWLDLQGVRKRYGSLVNKVNVVVRKIILEHGVKRVVEGEDKTRFTKSSIDFVDVMLDLKKEKWLRHSDMVVVLWFKPKHFLKDKDMPIMGFDFRLIPFGSRRKVCPGKAIGLATIELWLAMLL